MIGNKIEFVHYHFGNYSEQERNRTREERLMIGVVVDAYTEIAINAKSKRKYKVEYEDKLLKRPILYDLYDWQVIKIIRD